jgi:hypothetical protein
METDNRTPYYRTHNGERSRTPDLGYRQRQSHSAISCRTRKYQLPSFDTEKFSVLTTTLAGAI